MHLASETPVGWIQGPQIPPALDGCCLCFGKNAEAQQATADPVRHREAAWKDQSCALGVSGEGLAPSTWA
jgi:hypothetical protein